MSGLFNTLQERYQVLVARKEKGETGEEFLEDVRSFIADAQRAGAVTADLGERSQLRAWMRFLANTLYDATGTYPDTSLQPLARGQLVSPRPEREEKRTLLPPLGWALVGAAVLVIVAGSLLFSHLVAPPPSPTPTSVPPTLTSVPPTPVAGIDVGIGRGDTGGPALQAQVFCTGTTEIMAQFAVPAPLPADAHWGWRLTRAGHIAAAQSSLVWETGSTSSTVRVTLPDGNPLAAGQYELAFLVEDQPVANRTFEVLAGKPQVSNVRASDVPSGVGYTEFTSGIRVLYVTYDYEGLCAGLSVTRAIYFDGERVHESSEAWSGTSAGSGQLEYYQPGRLPLPSGEYEVALGVGEEEPQRVNFTIVGPTPLTFGKIIIALGVQPDGTPILTAPDNTFDWKTKTVYAIFDYVGMSDGAEWQAVWTRNGQELPRPDDFQDVGMDGTDGKHWVAYYDEGRSVLPGGSYSVTLYIDSDPQSTADFQILYYKPPE